MGKIEYIVMLGRFQPFHIGHLKTLEKAFDVANNVIIVIGSANAAPTPVNPFSAQERQEMITEVIDSGIYAVGGDAAKRVHFIHAEDRLYNMNKWLGYVQSRVEDIAKGGSVAIIGHDKGDNPYSLKNLFPMWGWVDTGAFVKTGSKVVSASKIRELLFEGHLDYTESNLPPTVFKCLQDYVETPEFTNLQGWYIHVLNEEKVVDATPYGMTFYTADSLVVQSGHVLLVKRGEHPGKGLWALPGVHVDTNERTLEASLRAVISETNLKVPEKVLKGSLEDKEIFDHPDRSIRARLTQNRARTISVAHYYQLDSGHDLPKMVRGGDGIEKAWWFPLSQVRKMRNQLFEDHADIIDFFIG